MRRETQIGVILGIVIIGIIAVFLSTRSSDDEYLYNVSTTSDKEELLYESVATKMENDAFIEETLIINIDDSSATDPKNEPKDNNKDIVVEKKTKSYEDKLVDVVEIIDIEDTLPEKEIGVSDRPVEKVVSNKPTEKRVQKVLPISMVSDSRLNINKETVKKEETESNDLKKKKKSLTHKVGKGDNLFSLAKKYYGNEDEWSKIYDANSSVIYDRNSIAKGSLLIIPDVEILELKPDEEKDRTTKRTETILNKKTGNIHIVQPGDSLSKLSKKYYGDLEHWKRILNANKDTLNGSTNILVGQRLKIPLQNNLLVTKKNDLNENKLKTLSAKTRQKKETRSTTYKIKRGDTLFKIAQSHYKDGEKWRKIFNANKNVLKNSNSIPAGKIIVIPE